MPTDIVVGELQNYVRTTHTTYRRGSGYWFVACPFHKEKTPSCKVNTKASTKYHVGDFKCFGCGIRGDWGAFSAEANLKGISFVENFSEYGAVGKVSTREVTEEYDPVMAFDWKKKDGDWRGIPNDTVRAVGGKKVFSDFFNDTALFLPCSVNGSVLGGITCRLSKGEGLSYLNTKGIWSKRSLYPYDHTANMVEALSLDYAVLVEGPRDALRLISYGIPAVAVLGVESWSSFKADLLYAMGISTLVVFSDGDKAGNTLYKKVTASVLLPTIKVKVQYGEDPGNCKESKIKAIKRKFG